MSLRTRVAVAVGVVVFCALAIVAAVVYPAVGANLRGKNDQSLVQVAKEAPTIAAKLKQAGTVGQLVPFGSTQLQILPAASAGPTNGFVGITDHDVQVADGNDKPYRLRNRPRTQPNLPFQLPRPADDNFGHADPRLGLQYRTAVMRATGSRSEARSESTDSATCAFLPQTTMLGGRTRRSRSTPQDMNRYRVTA